MPQVSMIDTFRPPFAPVHNLLPLCKTMDVSDCQTSISTRTFSSRAAALSLSTPTPREDFTTESAQDHWLIHLPDAPILEETEFQCTKFVASAITFKTSDVFVQRLESLIRNRIVNEQEWSAFITFCILAWKCCIFLSIILM